MMRLILRTYIQFLNHENKFEFQPRNNKRELFLCKQSGLVLTTCFSQASLALAASSSSRFLSLESSSSIQLVSVWQLMLYFSSSSHAASQDLRRSTTYSSIISQNQLTTRDTGIFNGSTTKVRIPQPRKPSWYNFCRDLYNFKTFFSQWCRELTFGVSVLLQFCNTQQQS